MQISRNRNNVIASPFGLSRLKRYTVSPMNGFGQTKWIRANAGKNLNRIHQICFCSTQTFGMIATIILRAEITWLLQM